MAKKFFIIHPSYWLTALAGAILFVPFLGKAHLFDWDEINFAESSREMLVTGNYWITQINFEAFWEKPPLFFWLQAICMKIFGVNEMAARLPNAIAGIITLLVFNSIGRRHFNQRFATFWMLIYAGSLLPHFYFKSGIIDPWFNLFIFLTIYYLLCYENPDKDNTNTNKLISLTLAGLFAGLATLTKGPVALLVTALTVGVYYLLNLKKLTPKKIGGYLFFSLIALLVGSLWFIALGLTGQSHVIEEFILYQIRLFTTEDADHGGFAGYHFVVILIGCFPASVLLIFSFFKGSGMASPGAFQSLFKRWMAILFWVVIILFTIVKTKIVHYSSLCYFPLSFLAAWVMSAQYLKPKAIPLWMMVLQGIIGFTLCLALVLLPWIDVLKTSIFPYIDDPFAVESFKAEGNWKWWDSSPAFFIVVGMVQWFRQRNNLSQAFTYLLLCCGLSFNLAIMLIVPKVERYSQRANIEFFKWCAANNYVAETWGYKSYGHLFYANRPPAFKGYKLDKIKEKTIVPLRPVYVSVKIHRADDFKAWSPASKLLYTKHGFAFFEYRPID
jgi:4-amino-4-deoxy-L-arabinose transferase-like glycosyltransferase